MRGTQKNQRGDDTNGCTVTVTVTYLDVQIIHHVYEKQDKIKLCGFCNIYECKEKKQPVECEDLLAGRYVGKA